METKIRKIGNSSGVVIAKAILQATDITEQDSVNISVEDGRIIIEKVKSARLGWAEKFLVAKEEEEKFFPDNLTSEFDREEWTW